MSNSRTVRLGTRGSELARWQTNHVSSMLQTAHPDLTTDIEIFTTRGDKVLDTPLPLIGGKGLFTAELEAALREERIDFAVHSLKDLPTENPDGLTVAGIPEREDVADVLVSREGYTLETLPKGAKVGTSSLRRAAQLKYFRDDLEFIDIRGNVPTRIGKAQDPDGDYDAIVLAYAGVKRLGLTDAISQVLPLSVMLPAPGQGALGIQSRTDDESLQILSPIIDQETLLSVTAERAYLAGLGGGCSVPIAAYAEIRDGELHMTGRVNTLDGHQQIEVEVSVEITEDSTHHIAMALGKQLAHQAIEQGANDILEAFDE